MRKFLKLYWLAFGLYCLYFLAAGSVANGQEPHENLRGKPLGYTIPMYEDALQFEDYRGTLYIPDIDLVVPLYSDINMDSQEIVDSTNSAALLEAFTTNPVIADHWNQGFNEIKDCRVGSLCYIDYDGNIAWYRCTGVDRDGRNTSYHLLDSHGADACHLGDGTLVMYTCNEIWTHITVVFWEHCDEPIFRDDSHNFNVWLANHPVST